MACPLIWNRKPGLYAVGNTPAVSLVDFVSLEDPATVLLLGCGDARNILFTAYSDEPNAASQIRRPLWDFTCCDIEPAVLSRNVILFALLAEGDLTDDRLTTLWKIYYHWRIDESSIACLVDICSKLHVASASLETWNGSSYGGWLRVCSTSTLSQLRECWSSYLAKSTASGKETARWERAAKETYSSHISPLTITHFDPSAGGPLWEILERDKTLDTLHADYWTHGVVTAFKSTAFATAALRVNPTFLHSIGGETFPLNWALEPSRGFHLAEALVDPRSDTSYAERCSSVAVQQFKGWCLAFRAARNRVVVRMFCGHAAAFCAALRERRPTDPILTAPWSPHVLALDGGDYDSGSHMPAPRQFRTIDTSNISDTLGVLNVLLFARPLLSTLQRSVLYTETMQGMGDDVTRSFVHYLAGDVATTSLLLGLAPLSLLQGFTSQSNMHDLCHALSGRWGAPLSQLRERQGWATTPSDRKLSFDSSQLAAAVHNNALFRYPDFIRYVPDPILKEETIFRDWKNVPAAVSVVLKVPRSSFRALEKKLRDADIDSLTLISTFYNPTRGNANHFSSLSAVHGAVSSTGTGENARVSIQFDRRGWDGTADVVVYFITPSWLLMRQHFIEVLGPDMVIWSTTFFDRARLFVTREVPCTFQPLGQVSPPTSSGADVNNTITALLSPSGTVSYLQMRVPVPREQRTDWQAGDPVLIKQHSPTTLSVCSGNVRIPASFALPVSAGLTRSKGARQSMYCEMTTPVLNTGHGTATSAKIDSFGDCFHRVDMSTLYKVPALEAGLPEWLDQHLALMFSDREVGWLQGASTSLPGTVIEAKVLLGGILSDSHTLHDGGKVFAVVVAGDGVGGSRALTTVALLFIAGLYLDLAGHTAVADAYYLSLSDVPAALLPVTASIEGSAEPMTITNDFVRPWTVLTRAFAERCRDFSHSALCPGSESPSLCACGRGVDADVFATIPAWEPLASLVTRLAISPIFPVTYADSVTQACKSHRTFTALRPKAEKAATKSMQATCNACGKHDDRGKLLQCSKCKQVMYCGKDCQTGDWKAHKKVCRPSR
ncbi:hypothetical protein EXIGLDRAFT_845448 [Exidia glandulosa HHB12029]|uniref:MYND-type domain-containing protein n=1 Tax=Exidia glandulosa HHB12029 TaxID=1314781 RepID=A0A165Z996_EXIGL|nr:hypothetical protein EXIGLDRAFT_845448 [Exidia glandulosa HHB12029]